MRDAVIAAIRNCAEQRAIIETEAARAEAGNVAEEEAPFLTLIDVKLALLPRIGRVHAVSRALYDVLVEICHGNWHVESRSLVATQPRKAGTQF